MIYKYDDEIGYKYISIHRKVIEFDPMNTDNPIILDYIDSFKMHRNNSSLLIDLIEAEYRRYEVNSQDLPISLLTILHSMNIAWVDLIHQMIFTDCAYDTFHAEYGYILNNIIINDTPDVKDSMIYRTFGSGTSIFHLAGKLWILNKYKEFYTNNKNNMDLDQELKYIFNSYRRLEDCFGSDRQYCILYMSDFSGITLKEYLEKFTVDLLENRCDNINETNKDI
jgi:hypothetical protein